MTANRKRGLTIHRAAEAPDLAETDFMVYAPTNPDAQEFSEGLGEGMASGAELKVLVRDPEGFSLVHVWFKPHYVLPRHTHSVGCMYYIISGSATMGSQTLRAGDAFFVPPRAPYQYSAGAEGVEVLEIRHGVATFDIEILKTSVETWSSLTRAVADHRDSWAGLTPSPTARANAG